MEQKTSVLCGQGYIEELIKNPRAMGITHEEGMFLSPWQSPKPQTHKHTFRQQNWRKIDIGLIKSQPPPQGASVELDNGMQTS